MNVKNKCDTLRKIEELEEYEMNNMNAAKQKNKDNEKEEMKRELNGIKEMHNRESITLDTITRLL